MSKGDRESRACYHLIVAVGQTLRKMEGVPWGLNWSSFYRLLGSFLVAQFQLAAMQRAGIPEEDRADFHLYIDEF